MFPEEGSLREQPPGSEGWMGQWIRIRVAGAIGVSLLTLLAPSPARAACPPLDVICAADELAGDPGDPPADPGTDPIDTIDREAGPAASPITDRVDQLLAGEGPGTPGIGGGTIGGGGGREHVGRLPDGRRGAARGPAFGAGRGALGPRTAPSASGPSRPVSDPGAGVRAGFGAFPIEVARGVLTVLLLFAIAGLFVLIQDRLDRRDPKLTAAPLRPEVITFR
jgi:hypothetical protein